MLCENRWQCSLLLLFMCTFLPPLGICLIYSLVFSSCKICKIWYSKIIYSFIFFPHSFSKQFNRYPLSACSESPVLGNKKCKAGVCSFGENRLLRRCKTAGGQCWAVHDADQVRESFKMLGNREVCGKASDEGLVFILVLTSLVAQW